MNGLRESRDRASVHLALALAGSLLLLACMPLFGTPRALPIVGLAVSGWLLGRWWTKSLGYYRMQRQIELQRRYWF